METIYKTAKLNTIIKEPAFTDKVGVAAMNLLEGEMNHLSSLFVTASFILVQQDFQNLSRLRRNYLDLKLEMAKYFQRLKFYASGARPMLIRPQTELEARLKNELQELTSRFQKFKSKLFSINGHPRGCL